MAAVAALAVQRKGELLAWFSLIKIASDSLGGLLGGTLLYWLAGHGNPALNDFHQAYAIVGGVGLLSLGIALLLLPSLDDEVKERVRSIKEVYKKMLRGLVEVGRNAEILLTSGMEGVQNMTMGVLHAFLPLYVVEKAGLNVALAGLLWTILTGVSVTAKRLMGRVSDRYGRRGPIISGMVLCAIPFALIPLFKSFWTLAFLAVLFGLGEAFVTTSTGALVADLAKQHSLGAALGIFGTIADTGQALGPIIVGGLLGALGYLWTFVILSGFLLLWTFFFALWKDHEITRST
jgi:DHA1 family multidrug resistance protein-like MFS transporter